MPDDKVEAPPTIAALVERARATFISQLLKTNAAIVSEHIRTDPQPASNSPRCMTDTEALAAFNNAISELVAVLDESRADLGAVQKLGRRHSFSATDPVCARCAALIAEANPGANRAQFRPAVEGDACSKCGAVVCVRRQDETDAQFRARLRHPSNRT